MINENTNRYILHLSYLGLKYSGWQIQNNVNTVQGLIMKALHLILHKDIDLIVGAGRTDSGVHAVNYFAHFDVIKTVSVCNLKYKLNNYLPNDIVIHKVILIDNNFHARFSVKSRKYEYWISQKKDPFLIHKAYILQKDLNLELIKEASKMLIGEKDFSSFSKSKLKNNICNVSSIEIVTNKNMVVFSIESDRFLYNMVRCIVGTLIDIGLKKINLSNFQSIIDAQNRKQGGFSVPAYGLYLVAINYPKEYSIENI